MTFAYSNTKFCIRNYSQLRVYEISHMPASKRQMRRLRRSKTKTYFSRFQFWPDCRLDWEVDSKIRSSRITQIQAKATKRFDIFDASRCVNCSVSQMFLNVTQWKSKYWPFEYQKHLKTKLFEVQDSTGFIILHNFIE